MDGQAMDKLAEALGPLAEKLGTTAEHLWVVLLKQAQIEGYFAATWASIGAISLVFGIVLGIMLFLKRNNMDWNDKPFILLIVDIIFVYVGLPIFFINLRQAIICFGNPEYWALQEVLKRLG